jgi:hypothetical protein
LVDSENRDRYAAGGVFMAAIPTAPANSARKNFMK